MTDRVWTPGPDCAADCGENGMYCCAGPASSKRAAEKSMMEYATCARRDRGGKFCSRGTGCTCGWLNPDHTDPHATRNRVRYRWVRALEFALYEGEPSSDDMESLGELLHWLKGQEQT